MIPLKRPTTHSQVYSRSRASIQPVMEHLSIQQVCVLTVAIPVQAHLYPRSEPITTRKTQIDPRVNVY